MDSPKITNAIISVSDKTGLIEFAKQLVDNGIELYSTGGTHRHLAEAGLDVKDVAEYTQFPEMMSGRVKTLHPKIFGGILGRRDIEGDLTSMSEHGMVPFDLVVVNLYPFAETIAKPDVTYAQAVEQIDIGGPSLVRAAAKNHRFVAIATSPDQYSKIAAEISTNGTTSEKLRRELMRAAFEHTAQYDRTISNHFANLADEEAEAEARKAAGKTDEEVIESPMPRRVDVQLVRTEPLRYGENPHQAASLYRLASESSTSHRLINAKQLNGKALSYNNYLDLDAAFEIARSLPKSAVSVIKHNNPCGAASADELAVAMKNAMEGDPVSAFGSVIGSNKAIDAATAEYLATPGLFVEAIVAPSFDDAAIEILTTKPKWKSNVRLMAIGEAESPSPLHLRQIDGGFLIQQRDCELDDETNWKVVTSTTPDAALMDELRFGWAICRHVKSNAITVSRDQSLCGVGAGQMSRVDSVEISIRKSGDRVQGAVLASDAFFPFPDSIEHAAKAGIAAIIQPGGSKNDPAVIEACNQFNIPMVMTSVRHFKH